jgi:hypothetical protein
VPLFNRTDNAPATTEARVTLATELADNAVRTFTAAADDMEDAATELEAAAGDAHAEADAHRAVAYRAESAATQSRSNADKIRALLG